jgi:hypothetical protein
MDNHPDVATRQARVRYAQVDDRRRLIEQSPSAKRARVAERGGWAHAGQGGPLTRLDEVDVPRPAVSTTEQPNQVTPPDLVVELVARNDGEEAGATGDSAAAGEQPIDLVAHRARVSRAASSRC